MTEIIDRMAETMADRAGFVWALLPESRDIVCGHGMPDGCRDYWRDMARVGLEAIREPTEAMINSPMARCYNDGPYADKEVRRIYSAMIDVALQRCP